MSLLNFRQFLTVLWWRLFAKHKAITWAIWQAKGMHDLAAYWKAEKATRKSTNELLANIKGPEWEKMVEKIKT